MEIGSFIEWQFPQGKSITAVKLTLHAQHRARRHISRSPVFLAAERYGFRGICVNRAEFPAEERIAIHSYDIGETFEPVLGEIPDGEAILLTNYFGIMSGERMAAWPGGTAGSS